MPDIPLDALVSACGLDPTAFLHGPAMANGTASLSFDDRFGSRSTLSSASLYYPLRRGIRSDRGDFNSEFGHIEEALGGQLRDSQIDLPSEPAPSSNVAGIPLPRARPAEANLVARYDGPNPFPTPVGDNRTMLQKIADMLPAHAGEFRDVFHGGDRWAHKRIYAAIGDTRVEHHVNTDTGEAIIVAYGDQSASIPKVKPFDVQADYWIEERHVKGRVIVGRAA